ncbi:palmitoyltransferase akr1 [Moniliophthora roreri]|nr:palmitoyltransferase akr1 [Moniliophthora roreri]
MSCGASSRKHRRVPNICNFPNCQPDGQMKGIRNFK